MRRSLFGALTVGAFLTAITTIALTADSQQEAIAKYHKQIEGTWKVVAVEVDGMLERDEENMKQTVVNGSTGAWSLHSDGEEISSGISTIDPTRNPKTIDFTPTAGEGQGEKYLGIYELSENTRKLCFASPGHERPTKFSTTPGSEQTLIMFERVKSK